MLELYNLQVYKASQQVPFFDLKQFQIAINITLIISCSIHLVKFYP